MFGQGDQEGSKTVLSVKTQLSFQAIYYMALFSLIYTGELLFELKCL